MAHTFVHSVVRPICGSLTKRGGILTRSLSLGPLGILPGQLVPLVESSSMGQVVGFTNPAMLSFTREVAV